jgi:ketosteroid isomerase-like protein
MSQQNVDAFKRAIDAYNRGDVDAFVGAFDRAAEWHTLTQAVFGGESTLYRGHEEIRRFVREVDDALADVRAECDEIRDLGERIVAVGRMRGRGRSSGAAAETPIGWVVDFADGKMVRMRDYLDPDEALEAARETG